MERANGENVTPHKEEIQCACSHLDLQCKEHPSRVRSCAQANECEDIYGMVPKRLCGGIAGEMGWV